MMPSYQGNAKPFVMALYIADDQASVMPVLRELVAKGVNLSYRPDDRIKKSIIRRARTVIVFLSAQSIADSRFEDAILIAKAMHVPLVCVNLDHTPLNDSMNRLLYVSNIIPAERYATPALLAERIMTAESLKNPTLTKAQTRAARRMALLFITSAVLVAIIAVLLVWQRTDTTSKDQQQIEQEEKNQPSDIAGLLQSGMTEEDLKNIHTLILVGDTLLEASEQYNYQNWDDFVTQMQVDGETVWSIDGKEIPRGTTTDISLIGLMDNLQTLILVNQSVTDLSPLQSLTQLKYIKIVDCPVKSLEALYGMSELLKLTLNQTNVTSLTPLRNCSSLRLFNADMGECDSIEGLELPSLVEVTLSEAELLTNLDSLSACTKLINLTIQDAKQLSDISGIAGCSSLKYLSFANAPLLRGSNELSALTTLEQLEIHGAGIVDLSWLKQSRRLEYLFIEGAPVRDLSWTSGMKQLSHIEVHGTDLRNLGFLDGLGVTTLELHLSGDIDDYSGLAAIPYYSTMLLSPRDGNLAAVLPYIADSSFSTLWLDHCVGIDFSALPVKIDNLWIFGGNLTNLKDISLLTTMHTLVLDSMNRLSSLEGLSECESLTNITIRNCIRLTSYEELYQNAYDSIELANLVSTPDLSRLQLSEYGDLTFESMASITDISPLEACSSHINTLSLRSMDAIEDLSALRNMHVVELVVSPRLEDQAIQLQDGGYIENYYIEYTEDELWVEDQENIMLLSLEELDTLPDALLARVTELTLIGDHILDPDTEGWTDFVDEDGMHYSIIDLQSGELTPVGTGTIDQISLLTKLENLQCLRLYGQPLTSLQGIQMFDDLRILGIRSCPVTDAAAAFTLTQLEEILLLFTQVTSIQGIQNLSQLTRIGLNGTLVSDLSPLKECNFDYTTENGGLSLDIGGIPCEEYSALAAVSVFSDLCIGEHDAASWLPYLAGRPIRLLDANSCNLTNELIAEIAELPQLQELQISFNEQVTDLSPLLNCRTLEKLYIDSNNTEAIASIEGNADFSIELLN